MGEHRGLSDSFDDKTRRAFVKALLEDVRALEEMLATDVFSREQRHIGAEQEMFLVGRDMQPAPIALEVMKTANDSRLATELARFNLEANLTPQVFGGGCLSALEAELDETLALTRTAARECGADILLTGILPTLRKADLGLDNMTPNPRYAALNREMTRLRDGDFHIVIGGIDELETTHGNVMLEACNTSFQIHFQAAPEEFARLYNVAQAITAPVLAAAANSPCFLGNRLWHETRVALFQRSVDVRSSALQARGHRPRVSFGDAWVRESVLEIMQEDIARFRVVLAGDQGEAPLDLVRRGEIPKLSALRLHTGTIYRWNRACYGVNGGVPHLRIENRVLPAGPTVADEDANASLFFGLMAAVTEEYGDITRRMSFDDAKDNFFSAARHGLKAQFSWFDGRTFTASQLLREHLIPMAREGLASSNIDTGDIDRYLGILEERVDSGQTGASWMLGSLARMGSRGTLDMRERALCLATAAHQDTGEPVHRWPLADLDGPNAWRSSYRTVGQFMSTDLFTVRPEDLVDLAASVMDWRHIRHVPVEDDAGHIVGLVTHRTLLRLLARGRSRDAEPVAVRDIMRREPVSVSPNTRTLEAMRLMRSQGLGCLPVTEDGRLVGIITERDLIEVSVHLLEDFLSEP